VPVVDVERQARWRTRLAKEHPLRPDESFALLADYGIAIAATRRVDSADAAVVAAREIGYPVVMKTAAALAHKSDVGGVVLGVGDDDQVRAGYAQLADAHGVAVTIHATAPAGVEVMVGVIRDVYLGPLVVVGAGGVLAELVRDTAVLLPPFGAERARNALQPLAISELLAGWRGGPAADLASLVDVVVAVGALAYEVGDQLTALDVNPVVVGPGGAVAVDVFVERTPRVRTD
jgi:succinyl-CoA synthetase beta subunit